MTRFTINPGEFRHVITFQDRAAANTFGENDAWTDVLTARAAIYPVSGKEYFTADRVTSEVTHKISMRYMPGTSISPDMRILFQGRIFQIVSVINFQERNVMLQLMCKELM
ncbi:phage head closure protein [Ectobacillus ponti]|uniref:Phage head closure protein n=1 Tax=Ectobacillus ponti TaxID=2961894 RepID=A0AA41XCT9_9BACI|nr:phage head closure protein [Ectobacillus ponti]MCP8969721.1 phage head closure protein [Ectobacillus ponti]